MNALGMNTLVRTLPARPWIWSFVGAAMVFLASLLFTGGAGAGGIVVAALSLASFAVVVGMGQMFVMSLGPGNVDLSLPANIGLASAIAMKVMNGSDSMIAAGTIAALASGMLIGLANYGLIRTLRIPPIIATLSTSFIVQSIDISYGRGLQVKPPPGFAGFTDLRLLGVPVFVLATVAASIVAAIVLGRTVFGRSVLAIGQNMRAAGLAGIKVERIRAITYMLCGALGGLSGALLAAYFRGSSTDIGNEYLLMSIAVVVIGGTSVAGGRANLPGLWGAALFLVLLQVMLNTFGADASVRLVTTGFVIIAVITAAGGRVAER
ncbi:MULTISPECIES: ABC transporter permease [unclassified Mesorhizobium]|uniref:ABC transporter permease n=1 Tax=unclassified Mesorhizobium TaxID=325217 RepID=UPI001FEDF726|nr:MULTISPECIES: ABC transporter permease [unclassified Mesorhizobium]